MPASTTLGKRNSVWCKVCGVRDLPTALAIRELGVDAIGLNFVPGSPRQVSPLIATQIVSALAAGTHEPVTIPIGLFVNKPVDEIVQISSQVGLQAIQLHGDEAPGDLEILHNALSGRVLQMIPLIRAWRVQDPSLRDLDEYLQACEQLQVPIAAVLLDAAVPGQYGGTGHRLDWLQLTGNWLPHRPPLILAGGLNPTNAGRAIEQVTPWGVDVASGVESAPGVKSLQLIKQFLAAMGRPGIA